LLCPQQNTSIDILYSENLLRNNEKVRMEYEKIKITNKVNQNIIYAELKEMLVMDFVG